LEQFVLPTEPCDHVLSYEGTSRYYRLSHATMLSYLWPTSPVGHLEQFVLPTEPTNRSGFLTTQNIIAHFVYEVKFFLKIINSFLCFFRMVQFPLNSAKREAFLIPYCPR